MGDDAQTKELQSHLDNTLSAMWNVGLDMDKVAEDCKVKSGESLLDRVEKCEAALNEWEKELNALNWDLATLEKLYTAMKSQAHGSAASIAEGVHKIGIERYETMKPILDKYRKEFAKHRERLRKVKA